MLRTAAERDTSGLKPKPFFDLDRTAEAVPFPKNATSHLIHKNIVI